MYPTSKPVTQEDSWLFYSVGRPTDRLVPRGQLPQRISDLLGTAQDQGKPTFGDTASILPDVPGLTVEGLGTVPLPLCQEIAEKVVKRGIGEQEHAWMLFPHLIKMKNPVWTTGVQTLAKLSSKMLGIKDAVLQPMLSKVMVVGPGGRLDKQQGPDIGRSMATLVVTLPSEYVGGDWMVFNEETLSVYRYDMGKSAGNTAFKPQYVVYAAGASYAMEEVTSGYCLVMVYSLCLPLGLPFTPRLHNRNMLRTELAEAVKQLKGGPDDADVDTQQAGNSNRNDGIIALVLSKTLTLTDIVTAGANALYGGDRDRFQLLLDANKRLPSAKQLVFYLARLGFGVPAFGYNDSSEPKQAVCWYSICGWKIGADNLQFINWTNVFNFLNPGKESLSELWGNDDGISTKGLQRFALVGWPASADIAHAVNLFGAPASVPIIVSHDFISAATLQLLLNSEGGGGKPNFLVQLRTAEKNVELLPFCQKLGAVVVELGDARLANDFVKNCVTLLKEREKILFLPWFATLVDRFDWENVSAAILSAIDVKTSETRVDRALELADILSHNSSARVELTTFALKKTRSWNFSHADKFATSRKIIALLNHAMVCNSAKVFASLSFLLKKINGGLLGPVIDTLSDCVDDSSLPEIRAALASVAVKRRQWLIKEVEESKRPFSWEIDSINFPDAALIVHFLEGPDVAFKICGFSGIGDARARALMLRQNIKGALKFEADGRGHDAFVHILKAGGDFDTRRKEVPKYEAEIDRLGQLVSDPLTQEENTNTANSDTSAVGKKRAREEEPDDIISFE
ncbi:hypothetical protein PC129_g8172 [Phytophthora cactorum]|uniref:Uncharacterized protein n=1 Tax=Phytophthora cactorum TaxID=29920 RepID=A0A329S8X8_9STRA|nr:hypothetical protein Pcac1_g22583 [Phytophthora cactorum]KAG2832232.1 hypothetical protein PC111_g6692 [Phytophthora cactorum]KAG2914757.1 hypothetical protein PC114_g8061 [Phytophthora cactorum]KAG3221072.1 hypothetical protein PC129_g8172 [Phytophthora cactorum]KAG4240676.1 hypothetical protein PC116_g11386 [Phytophthora cactorum]